MTARPRRPGTVPGTVHVIGAGFAGLSAAVALAQRGVPVVVHEATSHAGGRCRSYDDPVLGCRIDNGTHILVGANRAALRYFDRVGARGRLTALGDGGVPFADRASGVRWRSRLGGGLVPWWLALPGRRVPGTSAGEYLRLYRLFGAPRGATVTGCLGSGPLMDRLWRPLTEAALNTAPEEASARLLIPVVRGLLLGGAAAARIHLADTGLDDAFVAPGLAYLAAAGAEVRFASRLRALDHDGRRVTTLDFEAGA
ncbi:MAG: FAD-dependent oxidoreductase, partial [Alphaproteobacteria bacterium]